MEVTNGSEETILSALRPCGMEIPLWKHIPCKMKEACAYTKVLNRRYYFLEEN